MRDNGGKVHGEKHIHGENDFHGEKESNTAVHGKRKWLIMDAVIMLLLLLLDQFTKYLALTRLKGNSVPRL